MKTIAREYMAMGWPVFPVQGKIPVTQNGVKDASTDDTQADLWWTAPGRGIGLATGHPSGVWVLDLDGQEGADELVRLQEIHGDLPKTIGAKTGRGWHLYWAMPGVDVRNSAGKVGPKIDVRGTGGYVVMPPSPHPDGGTYEWLPGRSPADISPVQAPEWLMALVHGPQMPLEPTRPSARPTWQMSVIPEGTRDDTLFRLACSLRAKGLSEEAILAALREENRLRCIPPLSDEEVRAKASQAGIYPPGLSPQFAPKTESPRESGEELVELVTIEVLDRISEAKQLPIDAVPTPWPALSGRCFGAGGGKGWARTWHIVIGASSGAGKSIAAINVLAQALRSGANCCLISLEMSRAENLTRLLAVLSAKPVRSLEHGLFVPDAWQAASEMLCEQPGWLTTNPGKIGKLAQVESIIRQQADRGVRLVLVDYLQLAWVRGADMLDQITEVSHTIQGLAKELDITTVGLSQMNRATTTGGGEFKKEGLMGGSPLENDAEQVLLLAPGERTYDGYKLKAKLDKNRHGPQGEWQIWFNPTTLQMTEVER